MAVERTGSSYISNDTASVGSITVPADAEAAVVVGGGYDASGCVYDQLNWDNGSDLDFTEIIRSAGNPGLSAFIQLASHGEWPGSGADKTLYWHFSNFADDGPFTLLFFVKGINISVPTGDTDADEGTEDWTASLSGVGAGDLAVIAKRTYGQAVDADPTGSGQTAIYEGTFGGGGFGVGEELGEGTPTIETNASAYSDNLAFVIEAAAGGIERDIAGSLPAMSGALTRKHYAKRSVQGAI